MARTCGILTALLVIGLGTACDRIEDLRQMVLGSPDSADEETAELREARELYETGRIDDAVRRLEQIVQESPTTVPAFYYLGLCYLSAAGDVADVSAPLSPEEEKSLASFERAVALNPRHALSFVGMGDLFARHVSWTRRGREKDPSADPHQLALNAYEQAITIDPMLPEAQVRYAHFLERDGRHEEAEQAYKKAMSSAASIPEEAPDYYMAYGRFLAGRPDRLQEAIDQFELARMYRRDDPQVQREIGALYTRMGQEYFDNEQYSLAEQTLNTAYGMFPDKNDPEAQKAAATLEQLRTIRRR